MTMDHGRFDQRHPEPQPAVEFLLCRTPADWLEVAAANLDILLLDHASLELKAAEQAQRLIRRYGTAGPGRGAGPGAGLDPALRYDLVEKLSRLAREELRHFEQVVALIKRRGGSYASISPSRYAAGLHELARGTEPGAVTDALIVAAVIEARSCERFLSLVAHGGLAPPIARFYASLLRSEARHFEDYLGLARRVAGNDVAARTEVFLKRDRELIETVDSEYRFHSGRPSLERSRQAV